MLSCLMKQNLKKNDESDQKVLIIIMYFTFNLTIEHIVSCSFVFSVKVPEINIAKYETSIDSCDFMLIVFILFHMLQLIPTSVLLATLNALAH